MADLPFPWCIYAEHQSKAAACGRITDRSWGIENGLNKFLTAVESGSIPRNPEEFRQGVNRAIGTGSWVERTHGRLRRKYFRPEGEPHAERRMVARLRLTEIRNDVTEAEWKLLIAVAAGIAYNELAGITAGGARTRIARLRARFRADQSKGGRNL